MLQVAPKFLPCTNSADTPGYSNSSCDYSTLDMILSAEGQLVLRHKNIVYRTSCCMAYLTLICSSKEWSRHGNRVLDFKVLIFI